MSDYAAQLEALRQQRDINIQSLPVVTDLNLAFYEACHDLALQHGDHHGVNNWQHTILRAKTVRDMGAMA